MMDSPLNQNPVPRTADCKNCGDPLPDVRIKMNAKFCTYCQTDFEERQKQGGCGMPHEVGNKVGAEQIKNKDNT